MLLSAANAIIDNAWSSISVRGGSLREELMEQIELICPRCRRASVDGIVQSPLRLGQVLKREEDFILEGFLVCSDADCSCTYPILEGVPVILKDMEGWWSSEKSELSCAASDAPGMREYFDVLREPSQLTERSLLSSYMDLHYGAFCDVPAVFAAWADTRRYWETVVRMARSDAGAQYECSLDLGCSVGRYTFELAQFSHLAVGMDLNFSAVSAAAKFHRTKHVFYEQKKHGHCFEEVRASYSPLGNVLFLVADALDPPFEAEAFGLVAGLNLIDNVKLPLVLIGQMDALLRHDGILILCSPYEWRTDICEPAEWLESDAVDAPAIIKSILEGKLFHQMGLKYEISQELWNIPWIMRHHIRHWSLFLTHLIKARKSE